MLILLPPSEGKARVESGPPLDLGALSFPELTPVRREVLGTLVDLCRRRPEQAARVLGLGPRQAGEVAVDAGLPTHPCAPAIEVYAGVLYEALDYPSLDARARRRARASVAIASGLWGLVRPGDPIPPYRLSGGVTLPGVGPLAGAWRGPLGSILAGTRGVIVDLRSAAYVALGPVPASRAGQCATVRVLHEHRGRRTVVSHHNKATKGRLVRTLLDGPRTPATVDDVLDRLESDGLAVEPAVARDGSTVVDVIVRDL